MRTLTIILIVALLVGVLFWLAGSALAARVSKRLQAGGLWPDDEAVYAAMRAPLPGFARPAVEYAAGRPEVAYDPDVQVLVMAREVDYTPGSVQLRRPSAAVTRSVLVCFRIRTADADRSRTYEPLDPTYRLTKVDFGDGRFYLTVQSRNPAASGDRFAAVLTGAELVRFIEARHAPGATVQEIERGQIDYLRSRAQPKRPLRAK